VGFVLTVFSASSAVLYVRADAAGAQTNGLSWATAFNSISEALSHAVAGDELWVAAGTYRGPIQVPAGVALYGGFAGNESARAQRDWAPNKSVIDWLEWEVGLEFYNEQVGPTVSLAEGSRLDGFTIINGWHSHGAAVYAAEPDATIANNIITGNHSMGILGSAILADRSGHMTVNDDFFLKTANDLLRRQFPFGVTNIPVSQYSPAVHRLLQVAANLYDAARSNTFPSVFRPQVASAPEGPIIIGYYEDNSYGTLIPWLSTNQHGIPIIIGAREGFPNFNELVIDTVVFVARKLEMRRQTTNSRPYQTNEMYVVGIENRVGVEAWNSYTNAFSNTVDIAIANNLTLAITNTDGLIFRTNHLSSVTAQYGRWPEFVRPDMPSFPGNQPSFKIPLYTNHVALSNAIYRAGNPGWIEPFANANDFVQNSGFDTPEWTLSLSNSFTFVIHSGGRIVDFVHLPVTNSLGLTTNFFNTQSSFNLNEGPVALCWSTNRHGSSIFIPTEGVQQQIDISLGQVPISASQWAEYSGVSDSAADVTNFRSFVFPELSGSNNPNLIQQVPLTPARKILISARWEANDPLLHTLPEHLKDLTNNFVLVRTRPS
jgi:hypothetical protein